MTRKSACFALLLTVLAFFSLCLPVQGQGTDSRADPQQVKANLKNILDGSEFQSAQPAESGLLEKAAQWLRDMWNHVTDWFRKLFRFGGFAAGGSLGLQWVFIALFIAVGGYIAYRLIRNYLMNRTVKRAKARTAFDLEDTEEEEISREPNDWLLEAERRQSEGDFRRAYRAVFLAILLQFDSAGIVLFERSRANGEYLRLLRRAGHADLNALLAPLVLQFDLRWYGEKPTGAEDVPAIRKEYDRLRDILAAESKNKPETDTIHASLTPERA